MALSDRLKKFEFIETPKIVEEIPFNDFIMDALSQKVASIPVWFDYSYAKQFELIINFLDNKLNTEFEDLTLTETEKKAIAEEFLKSNSGFGKLDRLLAKDDVTSVTVNGFGIVYMQTFDGYKKTDLVLTQKQFADITARFKNDSSIVRMRQDKLFITLIKPPIADNMLIIRKIKDIYDDLCDLTQRLIIVPGLEAFLKNTLKEKKNIIVTGNVPLQIDEFMQVLINSIDETQRVAVIEDSGMYKSQLDNVSAFSVASVEDFDYEYLLSSIFMLMPDYIVSRLSDYKKLSSYYLQVDNTKNGLITEVKAQNIPDAVSKLTGIASLALKCTDKQAKLKLSSTYDYIIHIDKLPDVDYRLISVMELTSTKSSSLVMNEIVKFIDGVYVLDLPEAAYDDSKTYEQPKKSLKSFRSRLKN